MKRSQTSLIIYLLFLFQLIGLTSCNPTLISYQVPAETGDGWSVTSAAEVGMDEEPLNAMLEFLSHSENHNIDSVLIVKNGKLVLETYYPGQDFVIGDELSFKQKKFDRDTLHFMASVSKSITSLVFGIAVNQGKITDLDGPVLASFPEYSVFENEEKEIITLRHLLTMTAGLAWDEDTYAYTDERNDLTQMYFSSDPYRFVLEKPLVSTPGEAFFYHSGETNLLGEIIQRKTGQSLAEYSQENLFSPLGIDTFLWAGYLHDPHSAVASSLLYLKPRDMAKIGQMVLQDGNWNGQQIISADWIEESCSSQIQLSEDLSPVFRETGYGYQWWQGQFSNGNVQAIFAGGWGGQFIFVVPEYDLVVVLTGSNFFGNYFTALEVVNRYVLGSVIGYPEGGPTFNYGVSLNIPIDVEVSIPVHNGPGENYPISGEVKKGEDIYVLGWIPQTELENSWLKISPSGWVALKEVDLLAQGMTDVKYEDLWLKGNLADIPILKETSFFNKLQNGWIVIVVFLGVAAGVIVYWLITKRRKFRE